MYPKAILYSLALSFGVVKLLLLVRGKFVCSKEECNVRVFTLCCFLAKFVSHLAKAYWVYKGVMMKK